MSKFYVHFTFSAQLTVSKFGVLQDTDTKAVFVVEQPTLTNLALLKLDFPYSATKPLHGGERGS